MRSVHQKSSFDLSMPSEAYNYQIMDFPWCGAKSLTDPVLIYHTPTRKGSYWFHVVRPSACRQNRVRFVSSTILTGSISYLHMLSSSFRRCIACNFVSKFWNRNFRHFLKEIVICDFVWFLTWNPIWINSMGNIKMGREFGGLRTLAFLLL